MLETFNFETYAGREGETFRMLIGEQGYTLTLVSVTPVGSRVDGRRQPFSLLFSAPGVIILPQGTYQFTHPDLGTFDIFIVPIGKDAGGVQYEAVFT